MWRPVDEWFLFYPRRYPDGDWQPPLLEFHDVWFTASDGVELHGWYCPARDPRAVLVFAHGNAEHLANRAGLALHLQRNLGVSTFLFDYRGYGRSRGRPSVRGVLRDARAARSEAARMASIPESQIVLMGHSLGGAVMADVAGTEPIRGLILDGTFSSLQTVGQHHFGWVAKLIPARKLSAVHSLSGYSGPLLVFHGEQDRVVPFACGERVYSAAASNQKRFVPMPENDHNDPPTVEAVFELDRFFDMLPPGQP